MRNLRNITKHFYIINISIWNNILNSFTNCKKKKDIHIRSASQEP